MSKHPLIGTRQTPEHIEKRVSQLRGVCSSSRLEACKNNGFQKGVKPWNNGRPHSQETKAKMREAKLKKAPPPHKAGCKCFRCNKKYPNYEWKQTDRLRTKMKDELAIWRRDIFMRDNFMCCMCHSVGGPLNAHHIKKFSDYPELRTDINNGITLCKPCHVSVTNKEEEYENMFSDLLKLR